MIVKNILKEMRKDLYIFIGNKLISTDTILPLSYELKKEI